MILRRVRSQPLALAGLLAAAAVAWCVTAERMGAMDAGPGTDLGTLGWFTGVWAVMMAAMMLPSVAPIAADYASALRRRDPGLWLLFAAGYLLVWAVAGLMAYALFGLGKDLLAHQLAWRSGGRPLAVGVLALAALYQLTPTKRACLNRCRDVLRFVDTGSSNGRSVGFSIGLRNGGWCVGCSWPLMAALFALGVMSLAWMALAAALVTIEKLSPRPTTATSVTACVLSLLAVGLLAAPDAVPGLVVPGGHATPPSMQMG
jgi:predicted metal-binding membrane protein